MRQFEHGGFLEYCEECDRLIEEIRTYELGYYGSQITKITESIGRFGCVEENCVNAGQRILFTLHESHSRR